MMYAFNALCALSELPPIGKKAESLIALLQQGAPVPPGACLDAGALEAFLNLSALLPQVKAFWQGLLPAAELQTALLAAPLPPALEAELTAFLAEHPTESRWAVRSSGVQEDLAEASFAGLYTTELNVQGADELALAIKRCWSSLFSERVQAYVTRQGLDPTNLGLGVILQQMVPAEKSGVLFTVHPLSGHDTQMLIEAVPGLGEALVSGGLTPDRFVWDWRSQRLLEEEVFAQERELRVSDAAPYTTWRKLTPEEGAQPVLASAQIQTLCELALQIQKACGYPVDIEWVWAAGEFYIVQRRPITRLHYQGITGEWTTADFKDGGVSSSVCTPLMWSLYDLIWEQTMPAYLRKTHLLAPESEQVTWGTMFFGRPYWNVGAVKAGLKALPGFVEREFDTDLGIEVSYTGSGHVTPTNLGSLTQGLRVLGALKRSFAQRLAHNPPFAHRQRVRLSELASTEPQLLNDADLLKACRSLIYRDYVQSESAYFYHIFDNSNVTTLFKDSFKPYADKISYLKLISGLSDLSHLRQNIDLWELSRDIRQQPEALAYWQNTPVAQLLNDWQNENAEAPLLIALRAYIARYRHHASRELDLTVPRYGEDPTPIFESLKTLLDLPDGADPRRSGDKQQAEYQQERERLLALAPVWKRRGLAAQLDQLRAFLWWREELRDLSTRMYDQIRRFVVVLAERLAAQGALNDAADAFFLTIHALLDLAGGSLSPENAQAQLEQARSYYLSFRHFRNPDEMGAR